MQTLGIHAASDLLISGALGNLIASELQPIYDALYPNGPLGGCVVDLRGNKPPKTPPAPPVPPQVFDMLEAVGLYIYRDLVLLTKVLRVLCHHVVCYCEGHVLGRAAQGVGGNDEQLSKVRG